MEETKRDKMRIRTAKLAVNFEEKSWVWMENMGGGMYQGKE